MHKYLTLFLENCHSSISLAFQRQLNNGDLSEELNGEPKKTLKGSIKERMSRTASGMPVSSLDDNATQTTFMSSDGTKSDATGYVNAGMGDAEV